MLLTSCSLECRVFFPYVPEPILAHAEAQYLRVKLDEQLIAVVKFGQHLHSSIALTTKRVYWCDDNQYPRELEYGRIDETLACREVEGEESYDRERYIALNYRYYIDIRDLDRPDALLLVRYLKEARSAYALDFEDCR